MTSYAQVVQNSTTLFEYDAHGSPKKRTDPLGRGTEYESDELNRLTLATAPPSPAGGARSTVKFEYDGLDYLRNLEDPRLLRTSYDIDGRGNVETTISPDTKTSEHEFDLIQNLLASSMDARDRTTMYSFDLIGRPKSVSYATGTATTFEYDGRAAGPVSAKGRVTRMNDESGFTTYTYNAFGELESKTQNVTVGGRVISRTVKIAYGTLGTATGNVSQVTYPSGSRVLMTYDAGGRVKNIQVNPMNANGTGTDTAKLVNVVLYTTYNAQGDIAGWTWGNSSGTVLNQYSRTFDLDGRIKGYSLGNTNISGTWRELAYDAAGRIKSYLHSANNTVVNPGTLNQSFEYDERDRVTQFNSATGNQTYRYDANGNRIAWTVGNATYTNTVDANSNRLIGTTGPAPAKSYHYDNAGNILSDGTTTFSYSSRGRMESSTGPGGATTYLYNGVGQRVWQKRSVETNNPAGVHIYNEDGQLLGEYDTATGNSTREFIYHRGIPVAVLNYRAAGVAPNVVWTMDVSYIFADHLDTPRVIVRSTDNKVVWRWDNADPFGVTPVDDNPSGLGVFTFNLRMPGQYYDRSTNLFYNYFRDYCQFPALRRHPFPA